MSEKEFKSYLVWLTRNNIFDESGEKYDHVLQLINYIISGKMLGQMGYSSKKSRVKGKKRGALQLEPKGTLNEEEIESNMKRHTKRRTHKSESSSS